MDETTYSDPEVASLVNENFIPVKVDRDETDGTAVGRAVVEDYGYCILAALEAYGRSGALKYVDWALELAGALVTGHLDGGGFRDV